jgi:hypothetical protein
MKWRTVCQCVLLAACSFGLISGLASSASAQARWKLDTSEKVNFAKMLLQAQALASQIGEYHFFYGTFPSSFADLDSAGLAFTRPWNPYANRTARVSTTAKGLARGDFQIYGGCGWYIGTIGRDGKPLMIAQSDTRSVGDTVSGIPDAAVRGFLSDRLNFRIWAAQSAADSCIAIYESNVGSLSSLDELKEWGLMPFDGIGKNPITGGPILNEKSPGNVLIQRSPTGGWNIAGIGKDGKGIPVK